MAWESDLEFHYRWFILNKKYNFFFIFQMQKIGSQSDEFAIKQVNNKFIIFSSRLGFSLIWDSLANIKVVVSVYIYPLPTIY